ncbi:MAG: GIY-YIG nuclease family protein [Bacteroidota bacterium]
MIEDNYGIVYILSNPVMPGLIKIGITYQEDVKNRMLQLYSTGVPLPFECIYAAKVKKPEEVEKTLWTAFSPNRINPKREFFEIEAIQAISVIKLVQIEDVTPNVAKEKEVIDLIDREAGKAYNKKRPRLNFIEMGIPIGSELICVNNGETVIVKSDKTIEFRGDETSLTNATRQILENEYNLAPGPFWTYNGKTIRDIYNETYLPEDYY